jgi:transposase-like protein
MKRAIDDPSASFAARVVLDAIRGDKTIAAFAAHHEVHVNQVTSWKTQLLEDAASASGGQVGSGDERERIRELHANIGEPTVARSCLAGAFEDCFGSTGKRWTVGVLRWRRRGFLRGTPQHSAVGRFDPPVSGGYGGGVCSSARPSVGTRKRAAGTWSNWPTGRLRG